MGCSCTALLRLELRVAEQAAECLCVSISAPGTSRPALISLLCAPLYGQQAVDVCGAGVYGEAVVPLRLVREQGDALPPRLKLADRLLQSAHMSSTPFDEISSAHGLGQVWGSEQRCVCRHEPQG